MDQSVPQAQKAPLARKVAAARTDDANRGIVRLDPADLASLGIPTGSVVSLQGTGQAFARALPLPQAERGQGLVRLDGAARGNAGVALGETVRIAPADAQAAQRLVLAPEGGRSRLQPGFLARALEARPVGQGERLRITLLGGTEAVFRVTGVFPASPAIVQASTVIALEGTAKRGPEAHQGEGVRYEDLGGMGRVVERIREVVELPIRHRAAFERLGIDPPRGVLLVGPPGTGKTMIARAVATESGARFHAINGPEIVDKYYGASEQQLRAIFEKAGREAPSIIFIDEIDAIAPKRDSLGGEKQVERRIVAQLLTLMDGMSGRGEVVVIAATNQADAIDPALRRPGRFDREIRVDPPDQPGRREILAVHSRAMPLGPDVDLDALAEATHGHVGADLAALCREAAMAALRRAGLLDAAAGEIDTSSLHVTAADFAQARGLVVPSALRELFLEIPRVRWSEVGGLDPLRDTLTRAVVAPLRDPARFARMGVRPVRGVLLHGRPGTGKTLLARALATEAGVGFIAVRGPELLTHWQGASEKALREVFARARQTAPCILFFDELDAIAGARGSGDGATVERMVAQFLVEMDGVVEAARVVVLGATNRADRLDPALLRPGRFDLVVEMPLPDRVGREAILRVHANAMPLEPGFDAADFATATERMTGADLAGLCRRAALEALARSEDTDAPSVGKADFAAALASIQEGRSA